MGVMDIRSPDFEPPPGRAPDIRHRRLRSMVLAASGFTAEEIGWLLDLPRHIAVGDGVRVPKGGPLPHKTPAAAEMFADILAPGADPTGLRTRVMDLKPLDAVELLLWLLESVLHREDTMTLRPAPGLRLSLYQARLLHALDRHAPHVVTREALAAAMYRGDADDRDLKIVDVQLSKIRGALRRAKTPAVIHNEWSVGHWLERPDGLLNWRPDNGDHRGAGRERLAGAGGIDGGANGDHH